MPWANNPGVGDGGYEYNQQQANIFFRYIWGEKPDYYGVIQGQLDDLVLSGNSANNLTMATGHAVAYGFRYWNETVPLDLSFTAPYTGDTGGIVIMSVDWIAQTVRATVRLNTDGNATVPPPVERPGEKYEIVIAEFVVDITGRLWQDSTKTTQGIVAYTTYASSGMSGSGLVYEQVLTAATTLWTVPIITQQYKHLEFVLNVVNANVGLSVSYLDVSFNGYDFANTEHGYSFWEYINGAVGPNAVHIASVYYCRIGAFLNSTGPAQGMDAVRFFLANYTREAWRSYTAYNASIGRDSAATLTVTQAGGWYKSTAPITSVVFTGDVALASFEAGSRVQIFGYN